MTMNLQANRKQGFLKVLVFWGLLSFVQLPAYSQIFIQAEDFVEMNGVQTENCTDHGGGLNVGYIDDGDWMEYDINIPIAGNYIISVRAASLDGGGILNVINNDNSLGNINIPATGGWQNWQTIEGGVITLEEGTQSIRLLATIGGFNLNWFEIKLANPVDDDLPTTPTIVDNYSNGRSITIYWDSSSDLTTLVTGYKIFNNGNFVGFTSGNSIKLTSLLPEQEYTFDVYSCDLAGNQSNPIQVIASTTAVNLELIWFDEFEGTEVDQSKWNFQVGGDGWGNGEAQYYTNGANSSVTNGNLIIEARQETVGSNNYTSSRMNTSGKGDFLYGRIEVRAKLPSTGGTWPAIWTLPTEWVYGNWPDAGEIDIMEHRGNHLNYVFGTIHTGAYNHIQNTQQSGGKLFNDVVNTYHTYALEWYPDHLDWYYDDELVFTFNNEYKTFKEWPFDVPHHILLNVAIGGGLGGVIDHNGVWPQQMTVDYVRVYDFNFDEGDTIAPSAPTNLQASVEGVNVELSWNRSVDNEFVDKYHIFKNEVLIDSTSRLNYTQNNLDPLTDYSFSIKAKDFAGNYSDQASINVTTGEIQYFLQTDGKKIVNSSGEEVLLRGVGPGGWQIMEGYMMQTSGFAGAQHEIKEKLIELMGEANTETFFSEWRANHFTQRDVDSLAAWGYNSIRIPMHYNLFTLPIEDEPVAGENTWIETGFELIDNVLEWSAPHNMYVILDMHATPGGQGAGSEINDYDPDKPSLWESQENRDKLVALWTRIAERYKDNEWIGGYDLINETHWDLGPQNTLLRDIYEDITDGIRGVGDNHILFIEGNWYANDFSGLTPAWDDNIVYSFHKYWSYNDTASIQWVLDLRDEHNVPLWMGEAGENSNTWFTDAISLFENNNIGWAWWTMRKIGDIDSPYAVDINPGYQAILDYWQGNGPQPTEQEAFDGMMQLTQNLLVDNSRYRRDVPDACIRQVQTNDTKPFHGSAAQVPGVIHFSDFDLGKNNFAYYDTVVADYNLSTGNFTAWNSGWSYRNDGVDIERNTDDINSNGFHVGFVNQGEWMKYTVDINETAVYKASIRLASEQTGGEFFLTIDDQEVTTTQVVSATGGWTQFTTFEINDIILPEGEHSLKLHINNDIAVNLSSIEFEATGTSDALALKALNGKTGDDEQSVEITISESLLATSIDGTQDEFTVSVNGEDRNVISVSADPTRDRLIILNVEGYIITGDEILASYSGSSVQSESGKTLDTFTDLVINNVSPNRVVIPALIQVEDYDYMIGMGLEDTTDEGGGQNFGFTDPGDYADYSIFVPETGLYGIKFRVAGYNQGSIGLYTVDENDVETELVVVNTSITNGWQTWTTVSDNLSINEGPHKLRMKVLAGGFNFNWFEFDYPDSDGDGVLDDDDLCPNTPENAIVDIYGCEVFGVSPQNYALTVYSETCSSENNGSILLTVLENYNYSVTLTAEGFSATETFTSEISFEDLSAGTYTLCITIESQPGYEQCFIIVVTEPDDLIVTANRPANSSDLNLSLDGGDVYYINLNGETFITDQSEIQLQLSDGINNLSVKTNKDCQGIFEKTIITDMTPLVYPNPVHNTLFISTNGLNLDNVPVEIFDLSGKLILSKSYIANNNQLKIDLSGVTNGFFMVRIATTEKIYNYKIIKQ
jgi:beta-glucanase (GH16 family)